MNKAGSKSALITSAMFVAGIRMWMQVRGKTKTPFSEWAIGWGATFFILALLSEAAPAAAGSLSIVVAFADFLHNGVGLTTDLSKIVTGAEKGNVLTPQPFAATAQADTIPSQAKRRTSHTAPTLPGKK